MRLLVTGYLFVVIVSTVLAETEETTDNKPDEEEYEDIAVAESQDIGHSRLHPNNNSDDVFDRPRSRPRGRKRRRRLRKRPRSSTPSFIEEYNPERTVKDEETPLGEEDVIYQRRRPSKRRRRPNRRKPEYPDLENAELDVPREFSDDRLPHEYYRPRNPQRRRRKGSRKRIRVTTESISGLTNNTHDGVFPEITTQSTEVVVQSNNFKQYQGSVIEASLVNNQDETVSSTFPSAFTPKEITEINHKLESISSYQQPSENDYQVSGLGAFSIYQPSSIHSTTENHEENHIISSSTTKDYRWINRFDPRVAAGTTTEDTTAFETTTQKLVSEKKPQQNIKNIEKIIENRKNLFATTRRLPPTSALIRRRLRPRKHKNSTTTQETITDNTIATINPINSHKENKCQSVECALNKTSILANNIIPSALLPSGFPTMPEIISTAELIQNMSLKIKKNEHSTSQPEPTETEVPKQTNNNVIIITPSTLIRSPNGGENVIPQVQINELRTLGEISEQAATTFTGETDAQTDISTPTDMDMDMDKREPTQLTFKEVETKPEETTTSSSTESTPTVTTLKAIEEISTHSTLTPLENKNKTSIGNISSESDKLKLDGINVTNINDEILELIMDEMGKARVKRILELRNMTLSELIAHRERGAGHFSSFINQSEITNYSTEIGADQQKAGTEEDIKTEEETEKIIVEKAKHFLNEYTRSDNSFLSVMKSSQRNNEKFEKKLKVEGTVIPVPILEPTHVSTIQFPEERVLGDFPKYMYDIAGKQVSSKDKPLVFTETINTPKDIEQFSDKREPRVFDSMPKFNSEISNKEGLEISPYPDWRIKVSKSTEKKSGFPGISKEIMLVATSTRKPENIEDVILLDEGEEVHHLRNHILGGNINVESRDVTDSDYPDEKKVPAGVKSAIAASGALLGLAIFGFLAVLVSCKIRQRRARLRARRDILCEHLAEDIRSSQRSLTPVLRKSPFNHGIHSNTASSRHYYLWRTLRKTFQYE